MVKHIIIWNFKDEYTQNEKAEYAKKIKNGLEGLNGKIPGMISASVQTDLLDSSNGDVMLDCQFTDENALKAYQANPEHLKVAQFIKSVVNSRKCVDFIV